MEPAVADRVEAVSRRFHDWTGRSPTGVWAAPGRVNLIGEHTDYAGGFALPFAIDRCAWVAAAPRDDGRLVASSVQRPDDRTWLAHPEGVRAAAVRGGLLPADAGADLLVDSDVPLGAGLSSSAALNGAVALALLGVGAPREPEPDRRVVAQLCQYAENVHVGAPTGLLDPMASLFAAADTAVCIDFRDLTTTAVPLRLPEACLLVVDTRVAHAVADGAYADRRSALEAAVARTGRRSIREVTDDDLAALPAELRRRAGHVRTENARVLAVVRLLTDAATSDVPVELGRLLDASHASLRDDYEVSCPELDVAVEAARVGGAWGARMTGAGFGGSVVVLAPIARRPAIEERVARAFAERGWRSPTTVEVHPAVGARRVG